MREKNADLILEILRQASQDEYIGEAISQTEHALQCAHFATKWKAPSSVVLAALLHDIGHLSPGKGEPQMDGLGVVNHEEIGAAFLETLGMSTEVTDLIRSHVAAKRYLCFKNPTYLKHLSAASKGTLDFQGGPMGEAEACAFEAHSLFENRIMVRRCDEMAKQVDLKVPQLECYRDLLIESLTDLY